MRRFLMRLLAGAVLLFMAAFVLQHAGLAAFHDRDRAHLHLDADLWPGLHKPFHGHGHAASVQPRLGRVLFAPRFARTTQLVTNDFAYFNPRHPEAIQSPDWLVTSGSLFSRAGTGWTGVPDSRRPNATSSNGTGSATFRAVTRRRDFGSVGLSFDLLVLRHVTTAASPVHSYDGVHVFLHYRSQHSLYVVTVFRFDNVLVAKKKQPGGSANGGTYFTLGHFVRFRPQPGAWEHVLVTLRSRSRRSVIIKLYVNRQLMLTAVDNGKGSRPLAGPGAVGLRGDNAEFRFRNFVVRALRG